MTTPNTTNDTTHAAPAVPEVSHGRGGAGNIRPDDTQYTDGSVVREGVEGSHGDGPYSVGRGGAGNIGDTGSKPATVGRTDKDRVPSEATRNPDGSEHHTGRGGIGNEAVKTDDATSSPSSSHPISVADKLKFKLFGKKG